MRHFAINPEILKQANDFNAAFQQQPEHIHGKTDSDTAEVIRPMLSRAGQLISAIGNELTQSYSYRANVVEPILSNAVAWLTGAASLITREVRFYEEERFKRSSLFAEQVNNILSDSQFIVKELLNAENKECFDSRKKKLPRFFALEALYLAEGALAICEVIITNVTEPCHISTVDWYHRDAALWRDLQAKAHGKVAHFMQVLASVDRSHAQHIRKSQQGH